MIRKPSKRRSDPGFYSPTSFCLSIVFEAIMAKQLISWAENTDKLPTEQSGFRKHHPSNHKLFELTQAVCQAQRLPRRVGAILIKGIRESLAQWLTLRTTAYECTRFVAQMDFQPERQDS